MKGKIYNGSTSNRIKQLLLTDRISNAEGYSALLASDAAEMLQKYINVDKSEITVTINRTTGDRYIISITAQTEQIKNIKFI